MTRCHKKRGEAGEGGGMKAKQNGEQFRVFFFVDHCFCSLSFRPLFLIFVVSVGLLKSFSRYLLVCF
jgi:hypothetical protein